MKRLRAEDVRARRVGREPGKMCDRRVAPHRRIEGGPAVPEIDVHRATLQDLDDRPRDAPALHLAGLIALAVA
jgi:hypothetical protein